MSERMKVCSACGGFGAEDMACVCDKNEYGVKRNWPWSSFPEDRSTWDQCLKEYDFARGGANPARLTEEEKEFIKQAKIPVLQPYWSDCCDSPAEHTYNLDVTKLISIVERLSGEK